MGYGTKRLPKVLLGKVSAFASPSILLNGHAFFPQRTLHQRVTFRREVLLQMLLQRVHTYRHLVVVFGLVEKILFQFPKNNSCTMIELIFWKNESVEFNVIVRDHWSKSLQSNDYDHHEEVEYVLQKRLGMARQLSSWNSVLFGKLTGFKCLHI